jgi:hypothetical protein
LAPPPPACIRGMGDGGWQKKGDQVRFDLNEPHMGSPPNRNYIILLSGDLSMVFGDFFVMLSLKPGGSNRKQLNEDRESAP